MRDVLITGACGYLGANIADILADSGYKVTAFDRSLPGKNERWEKKMDNIIIGDITDHNVLHYLGKREPDAIIHLISLDHRASQGAPEIVLKINVQPAWDLLELFKTKKLKTFIFFSAQQVLGKLSLSELDETNTAMPVNQYGLTHMMGEQIVSYYDRTTDLKGICVRLSNGYGPPVFDENSCWWLVANDLCRTAYEKGKIILQSDGSPQRDFIHVKDIGMAVRTLLENIETAAKMINIGSGTTYTILELAHFVKKVYRTLYSSDIDIILGDGSVSTEIPQARIEKFQWKTNKLSELGFTISTTIEDGIISLFNYMESINQKREG